MCSYRCENMFIVVYIFNVFFVLFVDNIMRGGIAFDILFIFSLEQNFMFK